MNRIVVAMMVTMSLAACVTTKRDDGGRVVLPNYKLMGCRSPSCYQVWPDNQAGPNALYPKQVSIDIDNVPVQGVIALYDKSVSTDDIESSIDVRYGKWAFATNGTAPVKLWRVEPERFVIQLGVADNGMKQVIYLIFGAKSVLCCETTN
jgi:hypothetical protein